MLNSLNQFPLFLSVCKFLHLGHGKHRAGHRSLSLWRSFNKSEGRSGGGPMGAPWHFGFSKSSNDPNPNGSKRLVNNLMLTKKEPKNHQKSQNLFQKFQVWSPHRSEEQRHKLLWPFGRAAWPTCTWSLDTTMFEILRVQYCLDMPRPYTFFLCLLWLQNVTICLPVNQRLTVHHKWVPQQHLEIAAQASRLVVQKDALLLSWFGAVADRWRNSRCDLRNDEIDMFHMRMKVILDSSEPKNMNHPQKTCCFVFWWPLEARVSDGLCRLWICRGLFGQKNNQVTGHQISYIIAMLG